MNYLFDAGCTTMGFTRMYLANLVKKGEDLSKWRVYGWDPYWEPFVEHHKEFCSTYPETCPVISRDAVWIDDGIRGFNLARTSPSNHLADIPQLSSRRQTKRTISVKTVDLCRFISERVRPGDYAVLKLDIEGAEFHILPKLQATGVATLLSEVYVEYHERINRAVWTPVKVAIMEWWAKHPQIKHQLWR